VINIVINNRCTQILVILLKSDEYLKASMLSETFNVSNRTIRYDLDTIDEYLKSNHLPELDRKPGLGVKLNAGEDDKKLIVNLLKDINVYYYSYSPEERLHLILKRLLEEQDYVTTNEIAESILVSRNTIIKDLKNVREWLENHNLKLETHTNHGIKITGDERFIRSAQIELFLKSEDTGNSLKLNLNDVSSKINAVMGSKIGDLFNDIDVSFIEKCLYEAEKQLETAFSDEAYVGLVIHIALAIKRIYQKKDIVMMDDELKSLELTKEFSVASNIVKMLEERFKITIPEDEIGYITIHLLGSYRPENAIDKKENWIIIDIIVNQIIKNVSDITGKYFEDDKQLEKGLIQHLRPAIYRLKNGLTLKNPLLDEIKTNYSQLFKAVSKGLAPIEKFTCKKLSDEEIGYFTMYFGAAIERLKNNAKVKPDVLVVCATGVGTAELLSTRLLSTFDVNIAATIPLHQVNEYIDKHRVDLVVSTIPVSCDKVKCIQVNPLLNADDILKLKSFLDDRKTTNFEAIDKLMDIIKRHSNILEYDELQKDLENFFNIKENMMKRGVNVPMLKDLITEKTVLLNAEAENWEDAIAVGGEILEKNGFIEHRYIDAMIKTVKEIGPYIVIAPGIAMPHARPDAGVKEIGMSLTTLKNPVKFGNKDYDPVKVVICLCAVDNTTHLKALSELVDIIQETNFINLLTNAKDTGEVVSYIKNHEK
jgi:mannitol operon transcriptional antiterminator